MLLGLTLFTQLISSQSAHLIDDNMILSVGAERLSAKSPPSTVKDGSVPYTRNPLSTWGYSFNIKFSFGLNAYIETPTDIGLTAIGAGSDGDTKKHAFLGRLTQGLEASYPFFNNVLRVGAKGMGGIYLFRQTNTLLAAAGSRLGPVMGLGGTLSYYPLVHTKYDWSAMAFQIGITDWTYFGSKNLNSSIGFLLGFGGTF